MLSYFVLQLVVAVAAIATAIRLLTGALQDYPYLELFLRRLFLTRFAILAAVALAAVGPASPWLFPDLLGGLFVLSGPRSLGVVTFVAALTAATVLITVRVTLDNAPRRFADYGRLLERIRSEPPSPASDGLGWRLRSWLGRTVLQPKLADRQWGPVRWAVLALLALPVPVICLVLTLYDIGENWRVEAPRYAWGFLGGLVLALIWLAATVAVQRRILPRGSVAAGLLPFEHWSRGEGGKHSWALRLNTRVARALDHLGPGYTEPGSDDLVGAAPAERFLSPGHAQNFAYMAMTLLLYAALYCVAVVGGWQAIESLGLPPLFFALLLLMLLTFLLNALAFWLDYYRVSTVLATAVVSYFLYWVTDTDHFYTLNPDVGERPTIVAWLLLALACLAWLEYAWIRKRPPPWPGRYRAFAIWGLLAIDILALYAGLLIEWRRSAPGSGRPLVWAFLALACCAGLAGAALRRKLRFIPPPTTLGYAALAFLVVGSLGLANDWLERFDGPPRASHDCGQPADLIKVSRGWHLPAGRDGKRTLVIVTASGGGIQAAAWTARVLTGLHERYGPPFSKSIGVISAVSGGSLGTACYLNQWSPEEADPLPAGALTAVNEMARRSHLEASAWGMAYPDLLRLCLPPLVPARMDRGWSLEESWHRQFRDRGDWRLRDLADSVCAGNMPVPVFNATLAETGQRLLISPVVGRYMTPDRADRGDYLRPPGAVEYFHLFGDDADPRVATAVRLSATFPFVSPIPRTRRQIVPPPTQPTGTAAELDESIAAQGLREYLKNCHVVDGGYVDNEGAFTAAEWAERLIKEHFGGGGDAPPAFDRVRFVRIMPFPPQQAHGKSPHDWIPGRQGWANEFTGPVTALQNVRSASQSERNSHGLELLQNYANETLRPRGKGAAPFGGDDADPWSRTVDKVQFVFQLYDGDRPVQHSEAPLSWSLSRRQQRQIERAWKALCDPNRARDVYSPLYHLDGLFTPTNTSQKQR